MYKFMQRNKKKMLAVFGVGLMIVFILPTVAFDKNRGTSREVIAHLGDGEEITTGEARQAMDQWRALKQQVPQVIGATGLAAGDIEHNPELFLMLQREARQMGLRVSDQQVDQVLRRIGQEFQLMGRSAPNLREIRPAIANVMLTNALIERTAGGFKTSEPRVVHELAENFQRVKLELAHYSAEDFKKDVPAPTAEQLQKQFDEFKNIAPGTPTDRNPYGFGYLIPSRVKLVYLTVPRDEVARAVRKTRQDIDWEIPAVHLYNADPAKFATTQPAPTTASTTGPATTTTTAATTEPTTRPFNALSKAEREPVIREVMEPFVNKKTDEVGVAVSERMKADFEAVQRKSAGAPTDLGSRAHLDRVAADIEKRFGVKLGVSEINEPKDEAALRELKGIGQSFAGEQSFPQYVMRWAEPFVPEPQRSGADVVSLNEPSRPLRDLAGNVYVFQLREAMPAAAPAKLADVQDKVDADARTKLAFDAAVAAAKKLAEAAKGGQLESAAKAANKDVFSTPDFFDRRGVDSTFQPVSIIPTVKLPPVSHEKLVAGSFELLRLATPQQPHPVTTVELPAAGRVVVAQLADVERPWADADRDQVYHEIGQRLAMQRAGRVLTDYFSYNAVKSRLNYRPTHEAPTKSADAN